MADFDVIVLGLGPGGEEVAERLAEAGRSVLGIDPHLVGGECPYYGCIPSKMMLRGADVLGEGRRIDDIAGHADVRADFSPIARRIRAEATDNWDDGVAVDRLQKTGATFVRAAGRLAGTDDDGHLRVEAGGETHTAGTVVLATGTAPAVPPIEGLRELRAADDTAADAATDADGTHGGDRLVWTNREAVQVETPPASLIVIGGGAIGCELTQVFTRFGTAVTVLEGGPRLLAVEEPDASRTVTEVFEREGVTVRTGVTITSVNAGGDGVEVHLSSGDAGDSDTADGSTVSAEKLLVAAGRHPNLDTIGLDSVQLDPSVRSLEVDEHMQVHRDGAPVGGLYAVGDITGRGAFTHVAVWQARVLVAHLLERDEPYGGYHGLAWATFTDPEVGRVGMTEQQARDKGVRVRVGGEPIPSSSRGWIHGPGNDGFVKIVEDADRGVLVGATVVGPYGGEILGLLTLAVHAEVPTSTLASMHYAFPTLHRAVLDAVNALA